jgi:hypothetical protein
VLIGGLAELPWYMYKIFNFREQTLKMGANDAPGQGLQSALKTGIKLILLDKGRFYYL